MQIDIIGGSGFIGTRLAGRLVQKSGHTVRIIDKTQSQHFPDLWTAADIRFLEDVRRSLSADATLVHLAAEHQDDVRPLSLYREVNVEGTRNICTVAREKGVRTIVFTSSVAVYGFAPIGTDERGLIAPFNEYGRTKHEAELILRDWQAEAPDARSLVIIRPTVVFGEQNRGNVYNLLKQIATGRFLMIGSGRNRKSIAYVENIAAFIEFSMDFGAGFHVFNYVDKPDMTTADLVATVKSAMGKSAKSGPGIPFAIGLIGGVALDVLARVTGRRFPISAVRVRKFCANSVYESAIDRLPFMAPVSLESGLRQTIQHEFIQSNRDDRTFLSE